MGCLPDDFFQKNSLYFRHGLHLDLHAETHSFLNGTIAKIEPYCRLRGGPSTDIFSDTFHAASFIGSYTGIAPGNESLTSASAVVLFGEASHHGNQSDAKGLTSAIMTKRNLNYMPHICITLYKG